MVQSFWNYPPASDCVIPDFQPADIRKSINAQVKKEQMYSQIPVETSISKLELAGTSKL